MPVLRPVAPTVPQAAQPAPVASPAGVGDSVQLQQPAAPTSAEQPDPSAGNPLTAQTAVASAPEGMPPAAGPQAQELSPQQPAEAPQTFAQETGEKAGAFITQIIENNPQVEAWLQDQQLDDPDALANRFKEALQGSRLFRLLMRFDKRIVAAMPAEQEPMAREIFNWLKSPAPASTATESTDAAGLDAGAGMDAGPTDTSLIDSEKAPHKEGRFSRKHARETDAMTDEKPSSLEELMADGPASGESSPPESGRASDRRAGLEALV